MNRRDFLKRLGGAAAAVALSPLLDFTPIIDAKSVSVEAIGSYEFRIFATFNLLCDNPRRLGVITSIS